MTTRTNSFWSKKTQPARGWTAADICTNCVYTIPIPRDGGQIPFFGQADRRSLPPGWLCSSQTQKKQHQAQTTLLPITNKPPPTHKQQSTKRQKHRHTSNEHKRHQKQNLETKNLVHSTQPDIIIIQETKLTQKAKTPKYPTTPPYAHTEHKQ